jgi:carbon starvation protein CstA
MGKGLSMPKTRLGKWAGWLFVTSVTLLALLIIAYNTELLGAAFAQRTAGGLALWVMAAIAAVATLVTGARSWLKYKDRSAVVIVATIYGVLATVLLAMGAMPQV